MQRRCAATTKKGVPCKLRPTPSTEYCHKHSSKPKAPVSPAGDAITITFSDQAESRVEMQKLGEMAERGFSLEELLYAKEWFCYRGVSSEIHYLCHDACANAFILIMRNGLSCICSPDLLYGEQMILEKDTKALIYGKVVNLRARYSLCFGDIDQVADYGRGKGTVVAFSSVPLLSLVRKRLPEILGDRAGALVAEGNYYYDISKCGIGYHGDSERRKVVAIRLGATLPLRFHWFLGGKAIGSPVQFMLNHGDIYIMSEKAVGTDWRIENIPTLRHAAGCDKYLQLCSKYT